MQNSNINIRRASITVGTASGRRRVVLSNINLTVSKGELVYLIGKVGSGKSSLLKMLYGEISMTHGNGVVAGFRLDSLNRETIPMLRRKLGMVFQDFQLLNDRNIYQNLRFVLLATGWRDEMAIRKRIEETLDMVGLRHKINSMPHQLSGGEQQRIAVGRAFLNRPSVILADEPTGNLDPETANTVMDLFMELVSFGCSVVLATHNISLIEQYPARIIRVSNGSLEEVSHSAVFGNTAPQSTQYYDGWRPENNINERRTRPQQPQQPQQRYTPPTTPPFPNEPTANRHAGIQNYAGSPMNDNRNDRRNFTAASNRPVSNRTVADNRPTPTADNRNNGNNANVYAETPVNTVNGGSMHGQSFYRHPSDVEREINGVTMPMAAGASLTRQNPNGNYNNSQGDDYAFGNQVYPESDIFANSNRNSFYVNAEEASEETGNRYDNAQDYGDYDGYNEEYEEYDEADEYQNGYENGDGYEEYEEYDNYDPHEEDEYDEYEENEYGYDNDGDSEYSDIPNNARLAPERDARFNSDESSYGNMQGNYYGNPHGTFYEEQYDNNRTDGRNVNYGNNNGGYGRDRY